MLVLLLLLLTLIKPNHLWPCSVYGFSALAPSTLARNPWAINDADLLHRRYNPKYIPNELPDYIIIGSGIGGLWLSACLAKFNKTSLVLEQHDIAGGFQHTFHRGPYEFVPGMHYIANLNLCLPLYEMVATRTEPPLRFHQAGNATTADQAQLCSHDLQVGNLPRMQVREGLESVRAELLRVFPKEQKSIDTFLQLMEKVKWQAGQFATFKIFPPWLQFILSQTLCSNYIHYASLTTEQVLAPLTKDGRLKTVLSAFGGDLGESLSDGSFVMQAAVLGHVLEGCYYPEGGPIHFVRGLVPTIRNAGGDVLVKARVEQILVDEDDNRAVGVRLANGDILKSKHGVVSDAGIHSTLQHLLPTHVVQGPLCSLWNRMEQVSTGGISHAFAFVGLNASTEELKLRSSSFYYIPWNETNETMDATEIQDFYRNTLLDPNFLDVSAGMVFCTAKDPSYSSFTMPNRSTVIVFSEARSEDFAKFLTKSPRKKNQEYIEAKKLIEKKMMRSLLLNFPHLEPYVDFVEIGTPLTLLHYTERTESLGLRHTPKRMTDLDTRPDCAVKDLFFTGQDIAFAGK